MELFKGIPYAQPPVGSARWNPPMKLESFDELNKDEFQHQTHCIPSQVTAEEPIGRVFDTNKTALLKIGNSASECRTCYNECRIPKSSYSIRGHPILIKPYRKQSLARTVWSLTFIDQLILNRQLQS